MLSWYYPLSRQSPANGTGSTNKPPTEDCVWDDGNISIKLAVIAVFLPLVTTSLCYLAGNGAGSNIFRRSLVEGIFYLFI